MSQPTLIYTKVVNQKCSGPNLCQVIGRKDTVGHILKHIIKDTVGHILKYAYCSSKIYAVRYLKPLKCQTTTTQNNWSFGELHLNQT